MSELVIHNLDDELRNRLEGLASSHGHSVEDEVRDILREAILAPPTSMPAQGLGSRIAARFSGAGIGLTDQEADMELRGELRGHNIQPLDLNR